MSNPEHSVLTPEQERIIDQVVADMGQEGRGATFVEYMDFADFDKLLARYFEKGVELDAAVKRSLRNAVRRAFGLPERKE